MQEPKKASGTSPHSKPKGNRFGILDTPQPTSSAPKPQYKRLRSQDWQNERLSDKQRTFLATHLGRHWFDLAREGFGIAETTLDGIEYRCGRDYKRQALEMLAVWIEKTGPKSATSGAANRALQRIGLRDLAERHKSFARAESKRAKENRERRVSFGKSEVYQFDGSKPVSPKLAPHLNHQKPCIPDPDQRTDDLRGTTWAIIGQLPTYLEQTLRHLDVSFVSQCQSSSCDGVLVIVPLRDVDSLSMKSPIDESLVIVNVLQSEDSEPPAFSQSALRIDYFRSVVRDRIAEKINQCLVKNDDEKESGNITMDLSDNPVGYREHPYFLIRLHSARHFQLMQSFFGQPRFLYIFMILLVVFVLLAAQFFIFVKITSEFADDDDDDGGGGNRRRHALSAFLVNGLLRFALPVAAICRLFYVCHSSITQSSSWRACLSLSDALGAVRYFNERNYYSFGETETKFRTAARAQTIQPKVNAICSWQVACSLLHAFLQITFLSYCGALSHVFYRGRSPYVKMTSQVLDYLGLLLALASSHLVVTLYSIDMKLYKHAAVLRQRGVHLRGIDWEHIPASWRTSSGLPIYLMTIAILMSCCLHLDSIVTEETFTVVACFCFTDLLQNCPSSLMVFVGTGSEIFAYPLLALLYGAHSLCSNNRRGFFTVWILLLIQKGVSLLIREPSCRSSSAFMKEYSVKTFFCLLLVVCWLYAFFSLF